LDLRPLHCRASRRALGRTYEGFGETPELAEMMAAAMVKGLQGEPGQPGRCSPAPSTSSATAAPPGAGPGRHPLFRARVARHSPARLRRRRQGGRWLDHGVVLSLEWRPMHANRHLITDVLKGELGFEGFVISDWKPSPPCRARTSARLRQPSTPASTWPWCRSATNGSSRVLRRLVQKGRVPMARIDDAVRRILKQKARFKLWEHPFPDPAFAGQLGSSEHRALAREAVRQSAVLLKNQDAVLPLPRTPAFWLWAARRTTWASSAAAGRGLGGIRATSRRARRS